MAASNNCYFVSYIFFYLSNLAHFSGNSFIYLRDLPFSAIASIELLTIESKYHLYNFLQFLELYNIIYEVKNQYICLGESSTKYSIPLHTIRDLNNNSTQKFALCPNAQKLHVKGRGHQFQQRRIDLYKDFSHICVHFWNSDSKTHQLEMVESVVLKTQ